ncbi:hypothetical protein ACFY1P_04480 [Streptomyces sp. NPDC001407]|uniref:hypothetical protein n=1 Tax=Streptomyces sp. NPDC001407 TaxID=3364573 RepID=UPI0036885529
MATVTPALSPSSPRSAPETHVAPAAKPRQPMAGSDASPGDASALWGAHYQGTAKVTAVPYDYCGAGNSLEAGQAKAYELPATLDLGKPHDAGGQSDGNPFTLLLAVGQPSQDGAISLHSSAPSDQLLLTYWHLSWDGSDLSGELTDTHVKEGAALNLVNWPGLLVPCRPELGALPGGATHDIATGSTLSGSLSRGSALLTAKAKSEDGLVEFSFDFSGSS